MAFTFPTTSFLNQPDQEDQLFYSVIDRLKSLNALPDHSFNKDLPFFNIPSLPKQIQMRELFEYACDASLCKQLLKNIIALPEGAEYKMLPQNFSPVSVMSFAQITLYKVLPCPDPHCPGCPREIATHNQYKDFEYQCPFYHHERDRRRVVISLGAAEEFAYKANYYEEGRRGGEKDKYSQNYFESMFHPLYYKMFRCKRDFCNHSAFCPFFHCEEEKKMWDDTFCTYIRKDRVSYVKDKQQKPQDKKNRGYEARRRSSEEEETCFDNRAVFVKPRKNLKGAYQQFNQPVYYPGMMENAKGGFEKNWKAEFSAARKDSSDSSFEEVYNNYGFFGKLQATMGF